MKCILSLFIVFIYGYFFQASAQLIQAPFLGAPVTLPAKVEAENYDLGGQRIAYYDTDDLNQGKAYRSEGVDIENCSEGGYHIANIMTGEWIEYTVHVMATANYKLDFRTASDEAACAIRLDVDNIPVTTIALPNTKGWQNWSTTTVPAVLLSAGEHVLRLFVVTGGFNFNSFTFSNQAPKVSIVAPSSGTMFTAPASFSINANAMDLDGTVVKVDFYNGATLLGTVPSSPYSFQWLNVPAGTYTVTARATDNAGNTTTSFPVTLTVMTVVMPNQPPYVTLTYPVHHTKVNGPASIVISAEAIDYDGTISRVEFYNGSLLIGSDKTAPYSYLWTGVDAGVYSFTARAFDDQGASKTSAAALLTVLAVVSDVCASLPTYVENGGYSSGNKVKYGNSRYECKSWPYSGWCNGAAWSYAPGEGVYWSDAWNVLGTCESSLSTSKGEEQALILSALPNPFHANTNVSLVLKESGDVSLKLYDKDGMLIRVLSEGYRAAGYHDFSLNMEKEKPGVYLIKCITPSASIMSRMMKEE